MSEGGIWPIAWGATCRVCSKLGAELWCGEFDCGIHRACLWEYLKTDEGRIVIEHGYSIVQSYIDAIEAPAERGHSVPNPDRELREFWSAGRIKNLRAHMKLSQARFGLLLRVSWITIHRWETGATKPQMRQVERIEALARKELLGKASP